MRLPDPHRSRAVLIGTGSYGNERLPDLPWIPEGLVALEETLGDPRRGMFAAAVPLADPVGTHATGSAVATAADEAEDVLLVYLAGYLAPHGAGGAHLPLTAASSRRSRSAGLALNWLAITMRESRARHRILVVDALLVPGSAGPGVEPALVEQLHHAFQDTSVWAYLTADPAVHRTAGTGGSTFTRALLDTAHGLPAGDATGLAGLHERVGAVLHRAMLPRPVLAVAGADRFAAAGAGRHAAPSHDELPVALFRGLSDPVVPAADRLRVAELQRAAGDAERDYHRPQVAAARYRELLLGLQRVLGPDHARTLTAKRLLAHWSGKAGAVLDAVAVLQELLADCNRLYGHAHPTTVDTYTDLLYWTRH